MVSDFNEFLNLIAVGKKVAVESSPGKKRLKELKINLKRSNPFVSTPQPILTENHIGDVTSDGMVILGEFVLENGKFLEPSLLTEVEIPEIKPASQIYSRAEIDKYLRRDASFQQPVPDLVDPNIRAVQEKVKFLEQAIGRIAATGPGSGETRLRYLDDVDSSTIGPGKHLAYNDETGKFFFELVIPGETQIQSDWNEADNTSFAFIKNKPTIFPQLQDDQHTTSIVSNIVSVINLPNAVVGPIQGIQFDTAHVHTTKNPGTLCWNQEDDSLDIQHSNGIVQQVGQETYMRIRNESGSTILNGSCVRFAGATNGNGTSEARILVAPWLGDGQFPNLYGVGIATEDILNNQEGMVTIFGKVRQLNTTGTTVGEVWGEGDILYLNTTIPGALTNVKPTAPNNVVPIAAVVKVSTAVGEIFVRPTFEQELNYGIFERTTDLLVSQINTASVITFDTTEFSNGVNRVTNNTSRLQVTQSGLYQVDISAQIDSSGGGLQGATMYMWLRKNNTDVPDSTRRQGVVGAAPSACLSFTSIISLNAGDYIEIVYAGTSTDLLFDADTSTAFAPSTAAVKVNVVQIAQ